jgi:hypothetical protein
MQDALVFLSLSPQGDNSSDSLLYERQDNFLRYVFVKVKDVEDMHIFQQWMGKLRLDFDTSRTRKKNEAIEIN